jgi:hypothetical protein
VTYSSSITATIIYVLRVTLGSKFDNPDPEDVYIVMTRTGDNPPYSLCVTFKGDLVIRGKPAYGREDVIGGLQEVAEEAAGC